MSQARVLVVEDEQDIRELIVMQLKREGYSIDEVESGEQALALLKNQTYNLIVLDWMLPGLSGLEVARTIRHQIKSLDLSILMVTARAQTADIVSGLEAGADDYVTKPFDFGVLTARVRALLRRKSDVDENPGANLVFGDMEIDQAAFEARCCGQRVPLTASEFKLLQALAANKGRVLTRENLIELVQGQGVSVVGRAIDTHVFGLRKKLGSCADFVETIRGVGYRIKSEN